MYLIINDIKICVNLLNPRHLRAKTLSSDFLMYHKYHSCPQT